MGNVLTDVAYLESTARDPRSLLRALADREEPIEGVIVLIDEGTDDPDPVFAMSEMPVGNAWWMICQAGMAFAMAYMVPDDG